MRAISGGMRWALGLLLTMAVAVAVIVIAAQQPVVADRFGYALSRSGGLPGHFTYLNKTYSNEGLCAGGACDATHATRWSRQTLVDDHVWPVRQVGALPTLFGPERPIYEPLNDPSMKGAGTPYASDVTPFLLFVQDPVAPEWYYVYQRPGGP